MDLTNVNFCVKCNIPISKKRCNRDCKERKQRSWAKK